MKDSATKHAIDRVVAVLSMIGSLYVVGWIVKFFMSPRQQQNLPGEVGGLFLIFFAVFGVLAFLNFLVAIFAIRRQRWAYLCLGLALLSGSVLLYLSGAGLHGCAVAAGGVYMLVRYIQGDV